MGLLTASDKQEASLIRVLVLGLICILAFSTRLFSVLRYESVIHEFDPYFNFRTTKYLIEKGFYEFYNWFDDASWYPLGRIIGGTIYPGLMITAAWIHWFLHAINITIDVRNTCVFLAPLFAGLTALVAYFFGKEVKDSSTGLVAAALISIVPGYISRSVAGSYDNEGVAIFALLFTFYMFVKAVNSGSILIAGVASMAYFYMANAWGGYIFISNLVPLYVFIMLVVYAPKFSPRIYIAYSVFYLMGTLLSMQVRFINFLAVQSGEHMAFMGMFGLIQVLYFFNYVRSLIVDPATFRKFVVIASTYIIGVTGVAVALMIATGYVSPWTGRLWSLLDPTYAKEHIPIIASVSEHQPTTWASFFFDLSILVFLVPAGIYFCFNKPEPAALFIVVYGVTSVYFAGVMVRLMLVLAPAACMLGSVAISQPLTSFMSLIKRDETPAPAPTSAKGAAVPSTNLTIPKIMAQVMVLAISIMLVGYVGHCIWVTSEAYSSPSIVLAARGAHGRVIFDDFREAYYWLRHNTDENAKIMSWWDYGYQITAMANRTILVDNNTWNNTHIATVGKAMASNEKDAYEIMKRHDVDYVLVIFGGVIGYASDDINKFLWMVRIAGSVDKNIKEEDYFSSRGEYRVDKEASPIMLNSLMYKLSFYRFGEMMTEYNQPSGFDRVRNVEIGNKNFELETLEEAYSTEHFLVRIYKVKKDKIVA